jgi:hypothetical protein
MFPGWSAESLFEECDAQDGSSEKFLDAITAGMNQRTRSTTPVWHGTAAPSPTDDVQQGTALTQVIDRWKGAEGGGDDSTRQLARKLVAAKAVLRLSQDEATQLAGLAGNVVELDLKLDIDIDEDGSAQVTYWHHVMNLTDRPLTRFVRELWFEQTHGPLSIQPLASEHRRVAVQRIHDTDNLSKFACQFSPAVQPGETALFGFTCDGAQFANHFWRQGMHRYTRHFTLTVRQRGATAIRTCAATEEHADGSENSAAEDLMWDTDEDGVVLTLTRNYLRPNQAVTMRWEIERAAS